MTGPELKTYRIKTLGMTQAELAKALDITVRSLSTHENQKLAAPEIVRLAVEGLHWEINSQPR